MACEKLMSKVCPQVYVERTAQEAEELWERVRDMMYNRTRGLSRQRVKEIVENLQDTETGGLCLEEMAERCDVKHTRFRNILDILKDAIGASGVQPEPESESKPVKVTVEMVRNQPYQGPTDRLWGRIPNPQWKAYTKELCQAKINGLSVTLTEICTNTGLHIETVQKIYRELGGIPLVPGKPHKLQQETKAEDQQAAYEVLKRNVPESKIREVMGPGWPPQPQPGPGWVQRQGSIGLSEIIGNTAGSLISGGEVLLQSAHLVEITVRSRPIPQTPLEVLRQALV